MCGLDTKHEGEPAEPTPPFRHSLLVILGEPPLSCSINATFPLSLRDGFSLPPGPAQLPHAGAQRPAQP